MPADVDIEVADVRDAALKGISDWLDEQGIEHLTAMSQLKFGVVYVRGQTRYVVEVHEPHA